MWYLSFSNDEVQDEIIIFIDIEDFELSRVDSRPNPLNPY